MRKIDAPASLQSRIHPQANSFIGRVHSEQSVIDRAISITGFFSPNREKGLKTVIVSRVFSRRVAIFFFFLILSRQSD